MPTIFFPPSVMLALLVAMVAALFFLTGRLDRVLPRGSRGEALVQRWAGAVQALVIAMGLLTAVDLVYRRDAPTWRWLTVAVFAAALWSTRHALSDWGSGVVLRAEGTLKKGGRLSFGTSRGRIRSLGLRSVEVEAEDGRLLRLPYAALAGGALETSPDGTTTRSHAFTVTVEDPADPADVVDRIRAAALLSPWSATEPAPSARVTEREGRRVRIEVTVHPLDAAYSSQVERAVRSVLHE